MILLLIFMVAGIFFLKDLLLFTFTKLVVRVRSKILLSLLFSRRRGGAVGVLGCADGHGRGDHRGDRFLRRLPPGRLRQALPSQRSRLVGRAARPRSPPGGSRQFRAFLRSLVMHAAVGTALGGVTTLVGEPQNLLIGDGRRMGVHRVLRPHGAGLAAGAGRGARHLRAARALALVRLRRAAAGSRAPRARGVRSSRDERRTAHDARSWSCRPSVAVFLVVALAFHWAAVGLIGLAVIVLATAFTGVTDEHRLGHAFQEALPFTALLVVFFAIVAVIHDQAPIPADRRRRARTAARSCRRRCSSSPTVSCRPSATTFRRDRLHQRSRQALESGAIDREQFDALAVAINTGTNIPSVATPNGQAAFLSS